MQGRTKTRDEGRSEIRSLARTLKYAGRGGEAVPLPIPALANLGVRMRRGQLSLLVSAPGGGKTLVALNIALKAGVPVLYVSADTDASDQSDRAAALLAGKPTWELLPEQYADALALVPSDVRFDFDGSPTANDIAKMAEAYGMVYGYYPHLIIVDTLAKVWSDAGDETARNKEAVDRCQEIARATNAHVLVCHHLQKAFDKGDIPPSLDGLMSGVSKIPELVIGMWRNTDEILGVNILKNRSGSADASGQRVRAFLDVDFEKMSILDNTDQMTADWWASDLELMGGRS